MVAGLVHEGDDPGEAVAAGQLLDGAQPPAQGGATQQAARTVALIGTGTVLLSLLAVLAAVLIRRRGGGLPRAADRTARGIP